MGKLTQRTSDAAKGGFSAIESVRGFVVSIEPVPPPDGWNTEYMQAELKMKDAAILKMAEGADEFDLKEGTFTCMWNLGLKQEEFDADKNSPNWAPWIKGAVASAEALGKTPGDFVGTVATLERKPVILFSSRPNKDDDGNPIEKGKDGKYPKKDVTQDVFCFVTDEGMDSDEFQDYVRGKISGLTEKAARRKLITDDRLKQFKDLKDKLAAGTLAEFLGMAVKDGKFVVVEEK